MIFGRDNDIVCDLLDVVGVNEDNAFFESLIAAGQARHWEPRIFWGDSNRTHKVLVLCRTASIARKVKILTDIPQARLDLRKQQANDAGYTFYATDIRDMNVMVYY